MLGRLAQPTLTITWQKIRNKAIDSSYLAPLFRSMQSISNIASLPDSYLNHSVSNKYKENLRQWVQERKFSNPSKDQNYNLSIKQKESQYLLQYNRKDLSGMRIKMHSIDGTTASKLVEELIIKMSNLSNYTEFLSFLKISAKHSILKNNFLANLSGLREQYQQKALEPKEFAQNFINLLYQFEIDLIKGGSKRYLHAIQTCIQELSNKLNDNDNSMSPLAR